jgi:hypothetical protein
MEVCEKKIPYCTVFRFTASCEYTTALDMPPPTAVKMTVAIYRGLSVRLAPRLRDN